MLVMNIIISIISIIIIINLISYPLKSLKVYNNIFVIFKSLLICFEKTILNF